MKITAYPTEPNELVLIRERQLPVHRRQRRLLTGELAVEIADISRVGL